MAVCRPCTLIKNWSWSVSKMTDNQNFQVKELVEDEHAKEKRKALKKKESLNRKRELKYAGEHAIATFKRRVRATQARAEWVGVFYFLFLIAFAIVAFLPLYTIGGETLSVTNFYEPFLHIDEIADLYVVLVPQLLIALIYAFTLLSVVCNLLKGFKCLGKLFKSRPSLQNGYNRNAQAMVRLGKLYSGSLFAIFGFGLWLQLLAYAEFTYLFLGVLGAGLFFHFWLGLKSGSVSFFRVGQFVEVKRTGGLFVPFLRNLLQIVAVGAILYFFNQYQIVPILSTYLNADVLEAVLEVENGLTIGVIIPVLHLVTFLFIYGMAHHAFGTREFHHDGKNTPHRGNFRRCAFMTLLLSLGFLAICMFVLDMELTFSEPCYVAIVALVIWILELITRKYPALKDSDVIVYHDFVAPKHEPKVEYYMAVQPVAQNGMSQQPVYYPVSVQRPAEPKVEKVEAPQIKNMDEIKREEYIRALTEKWTALAENPPLFSEED